jgi:hypothetical protein
MSSKPITESRDPDLRGSHAALLRAAARARELARQTGTRLVIGRGGRVRYVEPHHAGITESRKTHGTDT